MIIEEIRQCRLCGNSHLEPVCDLGTMALTGLFPKTADEPVFQAPLKVVQCQGDPGNSCGLVQLQHLFDPRALFGESYGYRSGLNERMRLHLKELAETVLRFVRLKENDVVIDIGSSDGTFLDFFRGQNLSLIGIDPAASKFKKHYHRDITVVPDFFSRKRMESVLHGRKAKVITAIAVFYDLNNPLEFLLEVADLLDFQGVCVLEQSYWPLVLKNTLYDTICHEHAGYYGFKQLQWAAQRAGLKIVEDQLNPINGGSLRLILAKEQSNFKEAGGEQFLKAEKELETAQCYQEFGKKALQHKKELFQVIQDLIKQGKTVAGYGASTKGNVLLQFCGFSVQDLAFMAEVNEDKWGRFCPGSKIPIISEQEAKNRRPNVFLVLPWHFKEGIISQEDVYLRNGGKLLFPFPEIHFHSDL